jgi:hypothetical protein
MTNNQDQPGLGKSARNERTKLSAAWLNGGAIAALAIGCFAPITATVTGTLVPTVLLSWMVAGWLTVSIGLHFMARWVLRRVEE